MSKLFHPITLGSLALNNRVVMARSRCAMASPETEAALLPGLSWSRRSFPISCAVGKYWLVPRSLSDLGRL